MDEKQAVRMLLQLGQLPTPEKIKEIMFDDKLADLNPETEIPILKLSEKPLSMKDKDSNVEVLQHYDWKPRKIQIRDFVSYFRARYNTMKNLLAQRAEAAGAVSISRLPMVNGKATIVGMISDIHKLPTGTIKIKLEDLTGKVDAIISMKKPDVAKSIPYLVPDEVLAFTGSFAKGIFFVDSIIWPDIPFKTRVYAPDEAYAVFTGDIHTGSNLFLPKEFQKFISWLKGDYGDDNMRNIAKKTKYVFVLGDLIDGVGIYPEQEKELTEVDAAKQYDMLAKYFAEIPDDKKLIIIPGNHDALRLCEPQPMLPKDLAAPLYELPNAICVSNPATIKIHKQDGYSGFDTLMYHGYSFDHFIDTVEGLRMAGGYDAPDKVWEFLLTRRHLSPTYGATLALPMEPDPLVIKHVPDLVASGHIHKAKIGSYKNVISISGSCWQAKTNFQERVGHKPDPCFVPVYGLHNGKADMLKFGA